MRRLIVLLLLSSALGTAVVARAEIIERIIAKVNGEIITLSEFQERQLSAVQVARIPPEEHGAFLRQNNARLLQEAIDEILLIQRAADSGMELRAEFVDEIIESVKKENGIESEEQFQAALEGEGMTLADLRKNIERSWTKRMIIQREVEPRISVSEDELKEEYEKRKATDFTKAATVTLQGIFIPADAGGVTLARDIVARARAGADFASLARTHSADPTADSGGDLGELAQGNLSPDLEEVAFSLPVGSVSDPIPGEEGFWILRVVAKTTGSVVPYATAKGRVRSKMMAERFDAEYKVFMAEIREDQTIELRVREVPLQLTGPVPEDTLLDGVDPFSLGPIGSRVALPGAVGPSPGALRAPAGPTPAGPVPATGNPFAAPGADDEFVTTPQAGPERIVPGADLDDEISTTPQAAPERVPPPE
ncbi:MAG: peptidyl-prolyl cis-trans isomerase [Vicinamibacteria bacterium]